MKASDLIKPIPLEEIQQVRRAAREPKLRHYAEEWLASKQERRDVVCQLRDDRKAEYEDAERALAAAERNLEEAKAALSEVLL